MPTYDYECKECGYRFEAFQKMTDTALTNCPQCKAAGSLKRLISAGSGFIFKGSGFYITDYKKNNNSSNNNTSEKGCSTCKESQCPQAGKEKNNK